MKGSTQKWKEIDKCFKITVCECTFIFDLTLEDPGLSSVSVTDCITLVSEDEICCWRFLNISRALSIFGVITSAVLGS